MKNIIIISLFLINVLGCGGEEYSVSLFTYPPNSQPEDSTWEYRGSMTFYGPASKQTNKIIEIEIQDKSKKSFLNYEFNLYGGNIYGEVEWLVFDTLTIRFYEPAIGKPKKVPLAGTTDSVYINVLQTMRYVYNDTLSTFTIN